VPQQSIDAPRRTLFPRGLVNARLLVAAACVALGACATPYAPPVVVKSSVAVTGLADMPGKEPLHVLLVHGMCTKDKDWAEGAMQRLVRALDANIALQTREETALMATADGKPAVKLVYGDAEIAGRKLRMAGVVWSPLTAPLKQQLLYDNTDEPTDCARDATCKPKRATLNGKLKDILLNDCLADAMAYQGESRGVIRQAMIDAFSMALRDAPPNAPIVLVSDSLGSKISFDALHEMLQAKSPPAARAAALRVGHVYMNANQLPILGLADQTIPSPGPPEIVKPTGDTKGGIARKPDSLELFAAERARVRKNDSAIVAISGAAARLTVVAFTDPNDLLSYRLLPSRYKSAEVDVADVLVSNKTTYLGFLERPDTAHTSYMDNAAVATAISCGIPKSERCR